MEDTTGGILEDQAIFDHDLKSVRSHQEDYEAELETMLVQQQGMVDKMIKYLETFKDRMRVLEKRAGVPAPGPDVPQDPAPESLRARLTTMRTAAEGVAPLEGPMELAPYGLPWIHRSMLRHIPLLSASVMLEGKAPEKGSGIGTPKRDTRQGTVGIDMSSPPAPGTFDARAAYERRVAKMDSEIRGGASGDSWDQDPGSSIRGMVHPGTEEAKSGPRQDMEIRGLCVQTNRKWEWRKYPLGRVVASDVGDVVRIEDFWAVKIRQYDANDFIMDRPPPAQMRWITTSP